MTAWWEESSGHTVCVVVGPAGVGKSRLVNEFGSRLARSGIIAGRLRPGHEATAAEEIAKYVPMLGHTPTQSFIVVDGSPAARPGLPEFFRDVHRLMTEQEATIKVRTGGGGIPPGFLV